MRVVFMGTPEFAVPTLKVLLEDENIEVVGVFTQPDKPKGRGKKLAMPPVKELALENNLEVFQPEKIKTSESVALLKELNPELIVVVAFGQILSKEILDIPKYGCINVHASILPAYRGAAPINWAIIKGEKTSGVTTMFMDVGLDTGDMIYKEYVEISEEDNSSTLHDKLSSAGYTVLKKTIDNLKKGDLPREKQIEESSYAPIMDKSLGKVNWKNSAEDIYNLVRGVIPWPGAHTTINDDVMKIWGVKKSSKKTDKAPGMIIDVTQEGIYVATNDGVVVIDEIQMPNKKRMPVKEYLKGNKIELGIVLGE